MIELTANQFHIVDSLLQSGCDNIEPIAVLQLNNPGWVFVDSASDPKVALIWSKGNEGFYLIGPAMGTYSDQINRFIDSILSTRLKDLGISRFEVSAVSQQTSDLIPRVFHGRKLSSWEQCVFTYKSHLQTCVPPTPKNSSLHEMNKLITDRSILNLDYMESVLLNYWDSIDDFLNRGAGFCVVVDDIVASFCHTGWISSDIHEASVKTLEQYRRNGYAEICVASMVNYYLQNGVRPYWECVATNHASIKLAEKIGFTKFYDYTCYGFDLTSS